MRLFKSLSIFIVVFSLCFSLVGCGSVIDAIIKTEFNFLHEQSEIKSIQIVIIGEITKTIDTSSDPKKEVYTPNFDVIVNIDDIASFMDDFLTIDCYLASPPDSPTLGDTGIKITYKNGDYDVICCSGQGEYRDGVYYSDAGKNSFDKTQFDELINKYTNDINKND